MENKQFNSIEEECLYWKDCARLYKQEKVEVQKEFEVFTDESRQLEQELETTLLQNEKQINDLNYTITRLSEEAESLRQRLAIKERETNSYETRVNQLNSERESLRSYVRELEQKNDDLERTNRVVSESVAGFEAMLNQAYEKNAMLEMEIDEKEQMQINLQRLMDEARDLKQELKIRNISLPPNRKPVVESNSPISASSTPKKEKTNASSVSKINEINDSKNNNLSLNNASNTTFLDNSSSTTQNNSSLMDITLHNSLDVSADTIQKSQLDSIHNKSSTSVLKYDGSISANPIAASTRVSALNIVADLLKKLDNLEAKLKSWKTQKSPTQKLIDATASYNNNENTCSINNIEKLAK